MNNFTMYRPPGHAWEVYHTGEGDPYYHNTVTGVTQWDCPPELENKQQQQMGTQTGMQGFQMGQQTNVVSASMGGMPNNMMGGGMGSGGNSMGNSGNGMNMTNNSSNTTTANNMNMGQINANNMNTNNNNNNNNNAINAMNANNAINMANPNNMNPSLNAASINPAASNNAMCMSTMGNMPGMNYQNMPGMRPMPNMQMPQGYPAMTDVSMMQNPALLPFNAAESPSKTGPPGCNLFIFHVPGHWKETELLMHFGQYGNVIGVRLQRDDNGRNKGYGFVSYNTHAEAAEAIKGMNGYNVGGKYLKVSVKKGEEPHVPTVLREVMLNNTIL